MYHRSIGHPRYDQIAIEPPKIKQEVDEAIHNSVADDLDQITPPTLTPIGKRDLEISVKPLDPWHHSLLSVHRKGIEISYYINYTVELMIQRIRRGHMALQFQL